MAEALPVGAYVSGRLVPALCKVCGHAHLREEAHSDYVLAYVDACLDCDGGCAASYFEYQGGVVSLDDYQPDLADILAAARREHDESDDLCPTHHIAGPCLGSVDSHPRTVRGVESSGPVRDGRQLAQPRIAVPGWAWDLIDQLGRIRGLGGLWSRVGGDPR